jgi:hypothetical protein
MHSKIVCKGDLITWVGYSDGEEEGIWSHPYTKGALP